MKKLKKIIIYGGAFNPPTKAHQAILQSTVSIAEKMQADIWLMPSGERPDKTIAINTDTRIAMCRALILSVPSPSVNIHLHTSELVTNAQTNTYETVSQLKEKHPFHEFIWLFGADSISTMPSWPKGQQLINSLDMLVVPRPGIPLATLPPRAKLIDIKTDDMSSTMVRQAISNNKPYKHLLPKEVHRVIDLLQ